MFEVTKQSEPTIPSTKKFAKEHEFVNFLKTGECQVFHNGRAYLHTNLAPLFVPLESALKGVVLDSKAPRTWPLNSSVLKDVVLGVLVSKAKRTQNNKQYRHFFLPNADERTADGDFFDNIVGNLPKNVWPATSFECLRQLVGVKKTWQVAKMLAEGRLVLVDYTLDTHQPLTPEERKTLRANKQPKPPAGFTLLQTNKGWVWHRPATVLIFDNKTNNSYLLGQDERAFFGVKLGDNTTTVKSAFLGLIPPTLRKRKDIFRQGEWYVVPVKDEPPVEKCDFSGEIMDSGCCICLPVEDKDSNFHMVINGTFRIYNGNLYANDVRLYHNEHADVEVDGWVTFVRNTAVRSVSVDGVD